MSIFSVGLSGLYAAQQALNTTGNNISNVYTPGYNRELVSLSETGGGDGVRVEAIQRQFDGFVASQLNSAASDASALQAYEAQIGQIDNLLADREAGLAPLMQDFFSALEDLVGAPSDPAARQGVIGAADSLSAQFRSFDGYLQDMQAGVDGRVRDEIGQINSISEQIAGFNREIGLARAKNGEAPNNLLNRRDHLVATLSEHVGASVQTDDSGNYNVSIGNGQPLVAGTRHFELQAMSAAADPTQVAVGHNDAAGNIQALDREAFAGGALGGLLDFREETLDPVRNRLGRLAVSLASAINEQHNAGVNLEGDPGGDMFAVAGPEVFGHADNAGGAAISGTFDDPAGLTGAAYDLRVTDAAAGEFEITRRDSGESFTAVLDAGGGLSVDGVALTVDDPALLADGDRFRLEPTRRAAGGMANLINDTGGIAAGLAAGSGDNENALALHALQDDALVGGQATLSGDYAGLVGDIGNRTNTVQVNLEAREGLREQLRAVQQSESGVNLDEEAANLIRYQQYYQANAKVIQAGATVLDALLGLRA